MVLFYVLFDWFWNTVCGVCLLWCMFSRPFAAEPWPWPWLHTLASHRGQRRIVCTIDWVSGWSASIVHRVHATMSKCIKRPFCVDVHRVTDLAAFASQSFDNETLTWLIMPQTLGSLKFWLLLLLLFLSLYFLSFAKHILRRKAGFHSHSYLFSISICSYSKPYLSYSNTV